MTDVEKEKEMCAFLERKLDKFKEYQSVTEKMKQTVCGNDDNNELSGLIHRRQKCINAIEKINSSMNNIIKKNKLIKLTFETKIKRIP